MSKFILLKAASAKLFDAATRKLRQKGLHLVTSWPDRIRFRTWPQYHALLLSFETSGLGGFSKTYSMFERNRVFLFDGLPYTPQTTHGDRWCAEIRALYDRSTHEEMLASCRGDWSILDVTADTATASCDWTGMSPVFYWSDSRFQAISNRQTLLGLTCGADGTIDFDGLRLAWLTGQANVIGNDMPVRSVKALPPGARLRISLAQWSPPCLHETTFWTPQRSIDTDFSDAEIESVCHDWLEQTDALANIPLPPVDVDITGGMDSRLVAVLAVSTRLKERISALQTTGPQGSGEVALGARIAGLLGMPHRAIEAGAKSFDGRNLLNIFRQQALRYEGMICPTDGVAPAALRHRIRLTGSAGEIYRRHCKPHLHLHLKNAEELIPLYANYHQKTDPLGIQQKDVSAYQSDTMQRLALGYYAAGAEPNDITDIFYVNYRLALWNGPIGNNGSFTRIRPLVNYRAGRLAFGKGYRNRVNDRLHFEAILRIRPDLAKAPLLGKTWHSDLAAIAAARGCEVANKPFPNRIGSRAFMMKNPGKVPAAYAVLEGAATEVRALILDQGQDFFRIYDRRAVEGALARGPKFDAMGEYKQMMCLISNAVIAGSVYEKRYDHETQEAPQLLDEAQDFYRGMPRDPAFWRRQRVRFRFTCA